MKSILTAAVLGATMIVAVGSTEAATRSTGSAWSGRWNRLASEIDPGGPTTFTMHQVGTRLTGSLPWKGCTTRRGGLLVGWAQGRSAVLAARQTDGTLVLVHLTLSANGSHLSGGYQVTAGTCMASGPFTATRAP